MGVGCGRGDRCGREGWCGSWICVYRFGCRWGFSGFLKGWVVSSGGGDWCGHGDRVAMFVFRRWRCLGEFGFVFVVFFFSYVDLYIYFLDLLGLIY